MVSFQTTSLGIMDALLLRVFHCKSSWITFGRTVPLSKVTALNDYTTVIPLSDFKKYNAILALKINGKYMRIRDKGPFYSLCIPMTACRN